MNFFRSRKNAATESGVFYPAQIFAYNSTEDSFYVLIKNDNSVIEIPKEYVTYFSALYGAKTLQEHLEDGINEFGEDISNQFQSLLVEFVNLGLLRKIEKLWDENHSKKKGEAEYIENGEGKVTTFGIITHERPELLERCLRSYLSNLHTLDYNLNYFVFDDSKTKESLQKNKDIVREIEKELNVHIHYIGKNNKEIFIDDLVDKTKSKGVPEETIRFSLGFEEAPIPSTSGRNRNLFLLYTVGEIAFSVDDDTLFDPIATEEESIILTSKRVPNIIDYYRNTEDITSKFTERNFNLVEGYNSLFRTSVKTLLQDALDTGMNVVLKDISPSFCCLLENEDVRVTVGMAGHYGDSGIGNPFGILLLEGESRDMVYSDREYYEIAKYNRTIRRYVPGLTVYDSSYFFGACIATDHRSILPPFSPLGKNDDIFFAMSLKACFPRTLMGLIPVAIKHLPGEVRHYTDERLQDPNLDALQIVRSLMDRYARTIYLNDPLKRMYALGQRMIEVGILSLEDFKKQLLLLLMDQVDSINKFVNYLLHKYNYEPDFWVDDLENYLENLHKAVMDGSIIIPRDMRHLGSEETILKALQEHIYKYGQLLIHWPAIVEAAREIKAERGNNPI